MLNSNKNNVTIQKILICPGYIWWDSSSLQSVPLRDEERYLETALYIFHELRWGAHIEIKGDYRFNLLLQGIHACFIATNGF